MDVLGTGPTGGTFIALPAVVLAAVLALSLGGAAGFLAGSDGGSPTPPATSATDQVEPGCALALDEAARALEAADGVDRALVAHMDVFNDLVAGRSTVPDSAQRASPLLTAGARSSMRLDVAREQYESAMRVCPS